MIAAFDLSFTGTGWAIKDDHGLRTGIIESDPAQSPLQRMIHIADQVIAILHSAAPPKLVVLEGFAHGRAFQAHQMGGLGYIVREALQDHNFIWIDVAPKALKKFVSGNGNANKDVMIKNVYKRFSYDTDDSNVADAVGLVYVGMAVEGLWEPTTAEQRAVVDELTGKTTKVKKARKRKEA